MTETFEKLYRTLGRTTAGMLIAAAVAYGVALSCALLGFRHPAESTAQVAHVLAILFAGLTAMFLATSVAGAIVRWLDRKSRSSV